MEDGQEAGHYYLGFRVSGVSGLYRGYMDNGK